jgi:archaellum biogenesis ATPase FlaH
MAIEKLTAPEQRHLLCLILSSGNLYTRIQNIYNPQNFDRSLYKAAKLIQEHAQKYNALPKIEQVNASTGTDLEIISNIRDSDEAAFLDIFEQFTKREELERAILKSADLLGKGEFDPVEKLIKDAVQVSLTRDLGIEYFKDPRGRLMRLKDSNGQISTGWKDIDEKLYGGFNRGELNIFCGSSGTGKSLFLQNLALNWMEAGLNGIYITFELSQDLVAMRLDSMVTGVCSKDIYKNLDDVELTIAMAGKKYGRLKIKYMPSQSTVNQIKAYIKELSIQENFKPDFICLDYLDLIMPSGAKVDVADVFTKDKLVCEELRNFAIEIRALLTTASQLNRSGFDELEFSSGSIAGGISKLFTADNVFGIFTSRSMKERGAIQLQFMKTRNSGGVGQKVDLDFDVNSLRITNSTQAVDPESVMTGSNMLAKIRNKSDKSKSDKSETVSIGGTTENKKDLLKSLLGSINAKG